MKTNEFSWKSASGANIFAQAWLPETAPQAVIGLVHGLGEHSGRYKPVAETITQAGCAMLGFDLPGHGKSDGKRGHTSYNEVIKEIDRLLDEADQRFPGVPRFLYGHSLGGALTLYYLLRCQPKISGAIVTSPGLAIGGSTPAATLFFGKLIRRIAPSFLMENGLNRNNLSQDPETMRLYNNDPLVHSKISAQLGMDLIENGQWILNHASELSIPLLLVQGSKDILVSVDTVRRFAKLAPQHLITYQEWEGLYHETHNEREKQKVIQYNIDWIARQIHQG